MNKYTNFLTALIGGTSCTEAEVQEGFAALNASGVAFEYSNTDADGSFRCGRNKGKDYWGKAYLKNTGYILTPSYQIAIDIDSKDAGEMGVFSIGRMDDRELFKNIKSGRYNVELKDVFLALANIVIEDNEIYSQDAIHTIIERINKKKTETVTVVIETNDFIFVETATVDAESLKAARKAAKQAEKAAKIAAKKGRI